VNFSRGVLKRPRTRGTILVRAAYYFLLIAGILGLGYAGYIAADTHIYQEAESGKFKSATQISSPGATNPVVPKRAIVEEGIIGELEIPRLGLKVAVVQGDSNRILRRAVGHLPNTALPGEMGNVALAGHRDTFFRPLRNIGPGDAITLKTYDGDFEYRVESVEVVSPGNLGVLKPTGGRTLTLITCFPFHYIGAAPSRFIVRALQLENSPTAAPNRNPSRVP
jgi:sortase A